MRQTSHCDLCPTRLHQRKNVSAVKSSIHARIGFGVLCLLASLGHGALAADGDPDPTFSGDGMRQVVFAGSYTSSSSIQVASDTQGGIFVATRYSDANIDGFKVLKITPNGYSDTAFGSVGYASVAFLESIALLHGIFPQPDGSLILLGYANLNGRRYPAMAKLTASGNNDSSFGDGGRIVITQTPWSDPDVYVAVATRLADGKLLFVGNCRDCPGSEQTFLLRTNANGVPDPSFGTNGWASVVKPPSAQFFAITADREGRVVLAGGSTGNQALVMRVTSSGALDTTFGTAGSGYVQINVLPSSYATAIEIDSNGAVVVALVAAGNGTQSRQTGLIRLLVNGDRDLDYAGGFRDLSLEFGSEINTLQRRSDGRILAAGWIDHTGDPGVIGRDFLIARILPNGALDNSFDGNGLRRIALSTTYDSAEAMVLSAGKPVIVGISEANGVEQLGVLRMQSDLIYSNGFQ